MVRRTLRDRHRLHALALARTLFAGADTGGTASSSHGYSLCWIISSTLSHRAGKTKFKDSYGETVQSLRICFQCAAFFWLMTLLPSESQQPDGRLSLCGRWSMRWRPLAFGFFNDVVVGRWYPELNAGAQVPRPRESVRAGALCSCLFSSASTSSRPSLF